MGKRLKPFQRGTATEYMTRSQAVKKLQLTLRDFRRLCILKGIYPHEPKNCKKANKGKHGVKTFFYTKDILFLAHEPLIRKFRELRQSLRRITRVKSLQDGKELSRAMKLKPNIAVNHLVKERYPSFADAIHDMDDCLSMCFLFATFPNQAGIPLKFVNKCRRLTAEFMQYVICARALRKVFVSIKGIYFQVEIMGEKVTWIAPHAMPYQSVYQVDFKVMMTFTEFYIALLGFVNFKLFQTINLRYPPQLAVEDLGVKIEDKDLVLAAEANRELVFSLNQVLTTTANIDDEHEDTIVDEFSNADAGYSEAVEKARFEMQQLRNLKKLFEGLKIFLNREVPRESLTFIIRACGGSISWDKTMGIGATYAADDKGITHHIIDRPIADDQKVVNRVYIQPQWVFDSINARKMLPVELYFPGEELPPHLSPFIDEESYDYISHAEVLERVKEERFDMKEHGEEEDEEEEAEVVEEDDGAKKKTKRGRKPKIETQVKESKEKIVDKLAAAKEQTKEETKLAEMALPKRKRRLYQQIMHSRKEEQKKVNKLMAKRKAALEKRRIRTGKNKKRV